MTGLLQKIKCELWPRITPSDRYEEMCELAYIAENIVIYKQLSEPNLQKFFFQFEAIFYFSIFFLLCNSSRTLVQQRHVEKKGCKPISRDLTSPHIPLFTIFLITQQKVMWSVLRTHIYHNNSYNNPIIIFYVEL